MGRFKRERLGRDSVRTHDQRELPRTRVPTAARAFTMLALTTALGGCSVIGPNFVKPEEKKPSSTRRRPPTPPGGAPFTNDSTLE